MDDKDLLRIKILYQKIDQKNCRISQLQAENESLRRALEDMLFAYENSDKENPHMFETDAVEGAKQILKYEALKGE